MARFSNGWIKFYRTAVEGDLGQNAFVLAIWVTLLSWATRHEQKVMLDGEQRTLAPGTVIFGISELSRKLGCSKSTISKWLGYLASSERIALERRTRGCVVTIRNWKEYQEDEPDTRTKLERSVDAGRTLAEQCANPNGEVKKERINTLTREILSECISVWGKTLEFFKVSKDPWLDETGVARLVLVRGHENTKLALLGARFESKTETFDPGQHISIRRISKPDVFEKLVNLGSRHKPAGSETVEWEIAL
jgi:DNA-binding transcriptional regulator YhcF (GntR family)